MKCSEFDDNLEPYLDGFLEDELYQAMEAHRASCTHCAKLAKAHTLIMKSLLSMTVQRMKPGPSWSRGSRTDGSGIYIRRIRAWQVIGI